jgi:hypothetical protein
LAGKIMLEIYKHFYSRENLFLKLLAKVDGENSCLRFTSNFHFWAGNPLSLYIPQHGTGRAK